MQASKTGGRWTRWRLGWGAENARRSLRLCAVGAVLGLVIGGYGLFSARGTRVAGVPPEDVAVINGVPILRVDFDNQLRALFTVAPDHASAAQRHQVLEAMIREELYVQRGLELGVPTDDVDVRAALVNSVEAATSADVLATRPSPQELASYFAANRMRWASEGQMLAQDWQEEPGADPQAVAAALQAGGVAKGAHPGPLFGDGEEYWFAAKLHLGDALFAAAQGLADGAVSAPVALNGQVHILRMLHNQPPVPRPLEEVGDRVLADFQKDKAARLLFANDRFLRRRADIQIADDAR